ncbi:MAG: hypothetical protein IKN96_04240 [Oscillibacter sp.]|nr:hypothetical protein [Oscillibacter sp.]
MNFFLVDYENVHANGLNGISGLSEEDKVIIFYSEKAETITFGMHRRLNESKAEISFQKVPTGGKNALDFQLCTYLGYLICQNAQHLAAYYIVSGDQDYSVISDYWSRQNVTVSMLPSISEFSALTKEMFLKSPESLRAQLKNLLPEKYKAHIPLISDIIRRCKTKQGVNGELVRAFHEGADNSAPSEIYRCVKPLLTDKI